MQVKVNKIGTGTESDPIRPDTTASYWQVVEEFADSFIIEIFDEGR